MPDFRLRNKRWVVILALSLLLLAAVLIGLAIWLGWFGQPAVKMNVSLPGSASGDAADYQLDYQISDALRLRMEKLLKSDSTGLLASRYQLAGRFGKPEALLSSDYLAIDQLLYGQYLLEQDDQNGFADWWLNFIKSFQAANGLIRSRAGQADAEIASDGDFLRVNLTALRLLAQSCSRWPDTVRQNALQMLSNQILEIDGQGFRDDFSAQLPTPVPTLDPSATPTPKPAVSPVPSESGVILTVLRLASVDLFTLQQLAVLDARWQVIYDRYLPLIQNGYLGDDLPLYALGINQKAGSYLYFTGESPSIDTEEALVTLLHLCETGQDQERSLNWLRDQMFNQHAIYLSYHITQGQPTSNQESVKAYAIVARIARIKGDRDLYDAAVNRLLWHQATSKTSEALSAVFRTDSEGIIHVIAADNGWALLSLR